MVPVVQIPEEIIAEAAEYCKDDDNNSFKRLLETGKEFLDAGMTPVYLLDKATMQLMVIAKETHKKKLH
jgi:hypothetical protein